MSIEKEWDGFEQDKSVWISQNELGESYKVKKQYSRIHFLTELPAKENENGEKKVLLYRYIRYKYAKSILDYEDPYLIFSTPENWEDPYEKRFFKGKYEIAGSESYRVKPLAMMCVTTNASENEAASWLMYDRERKSDVVQLTFDFDELLRILNDFAVSKNVDVYVSKVEYVSREELDKHENIRERVKNGMTDDVFMNLMCLKRKSFKFEGEIRFSIYGNGLDIKDNMLKIGLEKRNNLVKQIKVHPDDGVNSVSKDFLQNLYGDKYNIIRSRLYDEKSAFSLKIGDVSAERN